MFAFVSVESIPTSALRKPRRDSYQPLRHRLICSGIAGMDSLQVFLVSKNEGWMISKQRGASCCTCPVQPSLVATVQLNVHAPLLPSCSDLRMSRLENVYVSDPQVLHLLPSPNLISCTSMWSRRASDGKTFYGCIGIRVALLAGGPHFEGVLRVPCNLRQCC